MNDGELPEVADQAVAEGDGLAGSVPAAFWQAPVAETPALFEKKRGPSYGSWRMAFYLKEQGHEVDRKRVQWLMRVLGLAGMASGPNTSKAHQEHEICPYLLRGMEITKPNQVWSTDITYIRLARGYAYLVAIIDWYFRRLLAWRLSNRLEARFCVGCLEEALRIHGRPEIFNTDQGSQFTSDGFTGVLLREGIDISMDGRGRALDNIFVERLWRSVMHEDVYLKGYASMPELMLGLTEYFAFYNGERPHQSLSNRTPNEVYRTGEGGGSIADHFGGPPGSSPAPLRSAGEESGEDLGQRQSAAIEETSTA